MKRTEIATIILVFSLSCVLAYFGADAVIGKKIKHEAMVEQTQVIEDDVKDFSPSKRIFNDKAINPTVEVFVEKSDNKSSSSTSTSNSLTDGTSSAGSDGNSTTNTQTSGAGTATATGSDTTSKTEK